MLIEKNSLNTQTYHPWINFEPWYFDIASISFVQLHLIKFWCPICNTPCNFERFCISNFICSNCFNKVIIFFKSCPCILWDEPTTHARMPMMPNNMSKVKHTTKGYYTFYICCIWVWNSSHWNFACFFIQAIALFSFHFYLACRLFKI